jgi:hypothetical protein
MAMADREVFAHDEATASDAVRSLRREDRAAIQQGWREQYDRMIRSHTRLSGVIAGTVDVGDSVNAVDALFHFLGDAYHVKDWLKNDPAVSVSSVETAVNQFEALRLCADLCNGIKHFRLDRTSRTGDITSAITRQSVTIHLGDGPPFAQHAWTAESNGKEYDVGRLADEIVTAWRSFVISQGLTS